MVEVGYKEMICICKGDYVTPILNVALSTPFYFALLGPLVYPSMTRNEEFSLSAGGKAEEEERVRVVEGFGGGG